MICGVSAPAALALVLVAATLALVSVPRFSSLALHDNERDARQVARLLAESAAASGELAALAELCAGDGELARTLTDAELVPLGPEPALRRHGYVFWLLRGNGGPLAVAWPWDGGRTGRSAYAAESGSPLREIDAAAAAAAGPQAARALEAADVLAWPERRQPD
jgi:hypothetical protein